MSSERLSLSPADLAWLAGLLEGEGCFYSAKTCSVILSMSDLDVVERAAALMGGTPVNEFPANQLRNRGSKMMYRTGLYGRGASELMLALLPHMGVRRSAKISEALRAHAPVSAVCQGCDAELTGRRDQKWCSQACKSRTTRRLNKEKISGTA